MENQEKREELVFEKGVKLPEVTGRLVFQFGTKEPISIANIYDNKPIQLILDENNKKITFKDEDGQFMVLKIVPTEKNVSKLEAVVAQAPEAKEE